MAVIIVRAKIAFAETAHGRGSAVEKTFIDRNSGRFLRAACRERMKDANPRAKGDGGLPEPALKRGAGGLIFYYTGRERLGSKWKIVADTHRSSHIFDIAS